MKSQDVITDSDLTLLASPKTESAVSSILEKKADMYQLLSSRLQLINPHTALFLLKNCLAVPYIMYTTQIYTFMEY